MPKEGLPHEWVSRCPRGLVARHWAFGQGAGVTHILRDSVLDQGKVRVKGGLGSGGNGLWNCLSPGIRRKPSTQPGESRTHGQSHAKFSHLHYGHWLFKSPRAKAVIGPRAWAGLGQLLERKEKLQLWNARVNRSQEPGRGHRQ